jgi:hypothetical protein
LQGRGYRWGLWRQDAPAGTDAIGADVRIVEGDYFGAMEIPLMNGRTFAPQDRSEGPLAAVMNEQAVERLFPDDEAVGAQIRLGGREWTVVGVVGDVANDPFGDVTAMVYLPHTQFADQFWSLHQLVSTGDPRSLLAPLRDLLTEIDPALVLHQPRAMTDLLAAGLARQRLGATVMGVFAALAMTLALVGIYGVLAFLVGRRTHEIGVRMALGARGRDVRSLVVRETLALAGFGIGAGLLGALALSRWLRALLFGVEVTDPGVYAAVTAGLVAVALLAAWLPARRAARVDPVRAFRAD